MKSISAVELEMVTGGKLDATIGTGRTGGTALSSGSNAEVLASLRGIRSSLKNTNSQGLFGGTTGAMMFGLVAAAAMRPAAPAASSSQVVYYGGGGYHHGPSFRARFAWG